MPSRPSPPRSSSVRSCSTPTHGRARTGGGWRSGCTSSRPRAGWCSSTPAPPATPRCAAPGHPRVCTCVDRLVDELGIEADRVTDVVLTHLHGDHAAGSIDQHGRPAFPHATYHVQARELDAVRGAGVDGDAVAASARAPDRSRPAPRLRGRGRPRGRWRWSVGASGAEPRAHARAPERPGLLGRRSRPDRR